MSRNDLTLYCDRIARVRLLSAARERALIEEMRAGCPEAIHALVAANLRIVVKLVGKFKVPRNDFDDAIQEGNLALFRAARMFDPERGVRFGTYAYAVVVRALRAYLFNAGYLIRLPVFASAVLGALRKKKVALDTRLGRPATEEELYAALGQSRRRFATVQKIMASRQASILSPSEAHSLLHLLVDHREEVPGRSAREDARERLPLLLRHLPQRDRTVLTLRFGLDGQGEKTLEEVACQMNMSWKKVHQISDRAIQKLRRLAVGRAA